MFDKLDYSMKMMAQEIEGLEFVEGKYLLDPNDPKAFNSMGKLSFIRNWRRSQLLSFLRKNQNILQIHLKSL